MPGVRAGTGGPVTAVRDQARWDRLELHLRECHDAGASVDQALRAWPAPAPAPAPAAVAVAGPAVGLLVVLKAAAVLALSWVLVVALCAGTVSVVRAIA